jgi:hypothetical protein
MKKKRVRGGESRRRRTAKGGEVELVVWAMEHRQGPEK